VDFADAVGVFEDPRALTMEDRYPEEERFRLISARGATRRERRQYERED
jgi:uncharacterized DUF497 family protein